MNWADENRTAITTAAIYGIHALLLLAIRLAEGRRAKAPFGVLKPPNATHAIAIATAAATIRNLAASRIENPVTLARTAAGPRTLAYTDDFIAALAARYAPIGADNDPTNLNLNWLPNVLSIYKQLIYLGPEAPEWADKWDN